MVWYVHTSSLSATLPLVLDRSVSIIHKVDCDVLREKLTCNTHFMFRKNIERVHLTARIYWCTCNIMLNFVFCNNHIRSENVHVHLPRLSSTVLWYSYVAWTAQWCYCYGLIAHIYQLHVSLKLCWNNVFPRLRVGNQCLCCSYDKLHLIAGGGRTVYFDGKDLSLSMHSTASPFLCHIRLFFFFRRRENDVI
jgi:hypothetical protein